MTRWGDEGNPKPSKEPYKPSANEEDTLKWFDGFIDRHSIGPEEIKLLAKTIASYGVESKKDAVRAIIAYLEETPDDMTSHAAATMLRVEMTLETGMSFLTAYAERFDQEPPK